ncbi:hypothetical protein N1Z88_003638 [Citrobacter amalonaticus]|nr:hypothetical protein [Citrobacter amalonaticus]
MSTDPSFKMSQDYELIPPKKKRAYPILVEEWVHLKTRIKGIRDNANFYHTAGSIIMGVAGSALVAALTLNLPNEADGRMAFPLIIAWFIFVSSIICGALCLFFAYHQREAQKTSAGDIITQMELIEQRYEVESN